MLAIVAAFAMASGCSIPGGVPGAQVTEEFNQTYPLPQSGLAEIENRNGGVEVAVWDRPEVWVHATKTTQYGSQELAKVDIVVEPGEQLRIRTVERELSARVSVNYEIRVPASATISSATSSNGPIRIEGAALSGDLISSNGPITVSDANGDIEVRTSNGAIDVRDHAGSVRATTSNARIVILDVERFLGAETSNGEIIAEFGTIEISGVTLRTSNARVTLGIPADLSINLDLATSNGRIVVDDPAIGIPAPSGTSFSGAVGGGGPTVTVRTSNADIVVDRPPLSA
jgi:DUF4097 and DUF4098 domain-containing protein YvlB